MGPGREGRGTNNGKEGVGPRRAGGERELPGREWNGTWERMELKGREGHELREKGCEMGKRK